jgi:hypothetical protein
VETISQCLRLLGGPDETLDVAGGEATLQTAELLAEEHGRHDQSSGGQQTHYLLNVIINSAAVGRVPFFPFYFSPTPTPFMRLWVLDLKEFE